MSSYLQILCAVGFFVKRSFQSSQQLPNTFQILLDFSRKAGLSLQADSNLTQQQPLNTFISIPLTLNNVTNSTVALEDDQEKPTYVTGLILLALLLLAAYLLSKFNNRPTETLNLVIEQKSIDNYGEGDKVVNERTMIAEIQLYPRLEGTEHIQKLLKSFDYNGDGLNTAEKWMYLIKNSKVEKIQKGHVRLDTTVVTFEEGEIPRNTYHNTLAFRMSIGLVRKPNLSEKHKKWKEAFDEFQAQVEEQKRQEEEKKYNKLSEAKKREADEKKRKEREDAKEYYENDYCEENPENFEIMFVLEKAEDSKDKIKSVQYTKQTGVIKIYYFNPLSQEDEEDDGIFIGKITDNPSIQDLKVMFDNVLLQNFSINKSPPKGGMYFEYYVKKYEDSDFVGQPGAGAAQNNENNVDGPGRIGDLIQGRDSD